MKCLCLFAKSSRLSQYGVCSCEAKVEDCYRYFIYIDLVSLIVQHDKFDTCYQKVQHTCGLSSLPFYYFNYDDFYPVFYHNIGELKQRPLLLCLALMLPLPFQRCVMIAISIGLPWVKRIVNINVYSQHFFHKTHLNNFEL